MILQWGNGVPMKMFGWHVQDVQNWITEGRTAIINIPGLISDGFMGIGCQTNRRKTDGAGSIYLLTDGLRELASQKYREFDR